MFLRWRKLGRKMFIVEFRVCTENGTVAFVATTQLEYKTDKLDVFMDGFRCVLTQLKEVLSVGWFDGRLQQSVQTFKLHKTADFNVFLLSSYVLVLPLILVT